MTALSGEQELWANTGRLWVAFHAKINQGTSVKATSHLAALLIATIPGWGQRPPTAVQSAPPTITSTTSLVLVPTLVRSNSGELIPNLQAEDFRLTDDGVEQKVSVEAAERQPLAVVVLMQTGGAAPRQFGNYRNLASMLEGMMGSSAYKIALVTFDSRPEEIWNFPPRVDGLSDAFTHPEAGDSGAAILDAVSYGIDLLEGQPASSRRILLLLSQPQDEGSKARAGDVVRRLGESNTTVYSVSFSPEKQWLKDQFTKPRHGNPPYQLSPMQQPVVRSFNLGAPIGVALSAMREDAAAEMATLSGGEHVRFGNRLDLEGQLSNLANHIPNRYTLSFRPSSRQAGLHSIEVQVLHQPQALRVAARTSYWSGESGVRQ